MKTLTLIALLACSSLQAAQHTTSRQTTSENAGYYPVNRDQVIPVSDNVLDVADIPPRQLNTFVPDQTRILPYFVCGVYCIFAGGMAALFLLAKLEK